MLIDEGFEHGGELLLLAARELRGGFGTELDMSLMTKTIHNGLQT